MAAKGPTPQTDIPRWVRTSRERPRWDERNRMIAAYVPPGSSVLDIGAGAQTLADHLPPGCVYTPADVVPGPGVLLCDLDADRWPEIAERHDFVVCSGVLEYLQDVPRALAGLPGVAKRAIVTYSDRSRAQRIERRVRQGWHSHLTLSELRAALDALEADWRFLTEWRSHVICAIDFEAGLPPLRDGDALIEEAAWESSFARLEAYALRTGGARVPNSLVEDGVDLGAWVQAQRRLRRRGTLSARRTSRLEAVAGWTWRSGRSTPGVAPEIAAEPGIGEGSLRPLRVELDRAVWMAQAAQGDPILDMTAGQGAVAIELARAGLQAVGFDRDAEALEQLRARLSEETPETRSRLTLVNGDEGPLPLSDNGFDSVLLADLGEGTAELLEEARRLVRPRGRIVLTSQLEVSSHGLERPRASLARLTKALGAGLRPVQIVDGERWVGIVAVFADPRVTSAEPWTALLEVAENRLARLGDAFADRAVLLEETRERERELAARLDNAVAGTGRFEQEVEARRREADAAAARHFEEVVALQREAAAAQERAEVAAGASEELREQLAAAHAAAEARLAEAHDAAEARLADVRSAAEARVTEVHDAAEVRLAEVHDAAEARLAEVRSAAEARATETHEAGETRLAEVRAAAEARRAEDAEALERERARGLELSERLGGAEAGREAEARRGAELAAKLKEEHARREALEAQLTETVASVEQAREEAEAAREHAERLEEASAEEHAAREHRLREVREDGRALSRELERRRQQTATLEAQLREAGVQAFELQAELSRATTLGVQSDEAIAERDALETELARARRQVAELETTVAERDSRIAERERVAAKRAHDMAVELEAARAEEASARVELEASKARERELRGDLRVQTARTERANRKLDSIVTGRSYRVASRLWRIRRRVRHPLGGPKKKPELPAGE